MTNVRSQEADRVANALGRIAAALERPPIHVVIYRSVSPDEVADIRRLLQLQAPDQRVTVLFANIQSELVDTGPLPYVGVA